MPLSDPKKRMFTVLMVILTVLANLVLAEVIIRIYNRSQGYDRSIWIPDRWLGYRHTFNNHFTMTIDEPEGKLTSVHRTNSLGLVGKDISVAKPDGVVRVIMLGDSFTEAFQVPEENNFCRILEDSLNQRFAKEGNRFEVLNAGVSGFSPISEYLYLKKELLRLKPDYIVVQLYANDVHNDNEATAMSVLDDQGLPHRINRYFYKDMYQKKAKEYHHLLEGSFWLRLHDFLVDKSRFYEYLYRRSVASNKNAEFNRALNQQPEFHHDNYFFIVQGGNVLFRDEVFRKKALSLTWRYLLAINDLAEENGSKLFVFYVPLHEQILPKGADVEQKFYFSQPANTYFNDELKAFTSAHGIPFHDMFDEFKDSPREQNYFRNDCHLTAAGHEKVADALLRAFAVLWTPKK